MSGRVRERYRERRSLVVALDTRRAELYGEAGPARAATRREIDSLIRVHPYIGTPTTPAQSITAPIVLPDALRGTRSRALRYRLFVSDEFLPAAPAEFTQTKPKSVRHFTSAVEMGFTSGTNGHSHEHFPIVHPLPPIYPSRI